MMTRMEEIGYLVFKSVGTLKKQKEPLNSFQIITRFGEDEDYDFEIRVKLIPKKTHKQIMKEMFWGQK